MRILSILGARPQFIKFCALWQATIEFPEIEHLLLHTGQHYDYEMSRIFFEELDLPRPYRNLDVGSGSDGEQIGRMLIRIEKELQKIEPEWVLLYGDTNSTLAGALASAKSLIPSAHIEAGLRSFNRKMPEEINRVLTDHTAELLFAPTETAVRNLRAEGIPPERIFLVGDVMYDVALLWGDKRKAEILSQLSIDEKNYILATIHRPENTDDPARLKNIIEVLETLADEREVILPLHPRTRKALESSALHPHHLHLIPPVSYLEMLSLEKSAVVILTDSGGVQKEAYFYRVPCVTIREQTEWVELVELGWNRVVPATEPSRIIQSVNEAIESGGGREPEQPLYGEGNASKKIIRTLLNPSQV